MYDIKLPVVDATVSVHEGLQRIKAANVGGLIVRAGNKYAVLHAVSIVAGPPRARIGDCLPLGSSMVFSGKTPGRVSGSISLAAISHELQKFTEAAGTSEPDFIIELTSGNHGLVMTPYERFVKILSGAVGWYCTGPSRCLYIAPPSRTDGEPCDCGEGILVRTTF